MSEMAPEQQVKYVLGRLSDCMEPSLFAELEDVMLRRGSVGRRIDPVRRERKRILGLLRAEGDKWFAVGDSHSDERVRQAAMETAAGWYKAVNLLEQSFLDEPVAVVEGRR